MLALVLLLWSAISASTGLICKENYLLHAASRKTEQQNFTAALNISLMTLPTSLNGSCYSVHVGDNSVTLHRKRSQMTTYQRTYRTSCRDVVPVELVQQVLTKANIEPVILANLSDPVSRELVREFLTRGVLSMLVDIEEPIPWARIMPSIKRFKALLVACDSLCVFDLIRQARPFGATKYSFKWLLVHPDLSRASLVNVSEEMTVTFISPHDFSSSNDVELQAAVSSEILESIQLGKDIPGNVSACNFEVINKRFLVPGFEQIVKWQPQLSNREIVFFRPPFDNQVTQFYNRTFRILTLEYSFFVQRPKTPGGKWTGLSFQILNELANKLNFSYTISRQKDEVYGLPLDRNNFTYGGWTGMIGEIVNRKFDFSTATFSITWERMQAVDHSSSIYRDWMITIIKRPQPESRLWMYIQLNQPTLWAIIFASILLTSITFWFLTNWSYCYNEQGDSDPLVAELQRFGYSLIYFAFTIITEGGNYLPVTLSGRIVIVTWWVFCIVFLAVYSGTLVAYLAVTVVNLPFTTLEGLVAQSAYKWAIPKGIMLNTVLEHSTNPVYQKLSKGKVAVESYNTAYQHIVDNQALIIESAWYVTAQAKGCNITRLNDRFFPTSYAWTFPLDSPLQTVISQNIDSLYESGIIQRWTREYTSKYGCQPMNSASNSPSLTVTFETVSGAFLILAFGLAASVLAFSVEFLVSRWKQKRKVSKPMTRQVSTRRPSEVAPFSGRVVTTSLAPRPLADLEVADLEIESGAKRSSIHQD